MAGLLSRLGLFSYRHRLAVVLVWLLVLIAAGVGAGTLSGKTSNSFSIPGQESTTALQLIREKFGAGGSTAGAQVVVKAPAGQLLTTPSNATAVETLVGRLSTLPGAASASDPLKKTAPTLSPDRTTAYSTVTYRVAQGDVTAAQRTALLDAVDTARHSGLTAEVSGTAVTATSATGAVGEAVGVLIALLILGITYGSLVAAGMTLLTAAVGVGAGLLGITIATGFLSLSSTTPALASMLGLAVGIDYALFIVTRFRQELRRGLDVRAAVGTAVGTAGAAVVTAGTTVVIALLGLFVAGIPFLTQMGVAAAATVVVAVGVAVTLVPAVLSLLGRRALPRRQRPAADPPTDDQELTVRDRGFFRGWIAAVTRRRVSALVLSVAALAAIALPVISLQTTLVQTPAAGSTQARAQQLLASAFGPGFNGPVTVLFDGTGAVRTAAQVKASITRLPDVAAAVGPIPARDGSAALMTVLPKSGPASAATEQLVPDLRGLLAHTGGARAYVTGSTAVSVDVAKTLSDALPVYLALVVGLAFVLLVLVFRSLLVPLVGVLGFLLTIGASLGATVAVFQWGWFAGAVNLESTGPLISLTPILVIGILFGLAMDYQVFLVSRMHEAHSHGKAPLEAIGTGFRHAAPVVVAAAAIMFSVFASFVPGGDATIKSIAFALATGIAFDAFVVRMVLVPAALALLGERAWWLPRWLRWLPTVDVEGAALEQRPFRPERRELATASAGPGNGSAG
jgi:RND superfamily putative drug exporter